MTQSLQELRVCMDIGSREHYVGIGLSNGQRLDEFKLSHTIEDIRNFFLRIEKINSKYNYNVVVAMEGYNGYARPIDTMVLDRGYKLYNVNNMKLARFKEIFPGPAKSDPIDTWKIFDLFAIKDSLPLAKDVLQEITKPSETDERLKKITRRRRDLVNEKVQIVNRIQADLESVCPGILSITKSVDNIWFLNFLMAREDITKLIRLQRSSILKIKGVGKKYAQTIEDWQKTAYFSPAVAWVGNMIVRDAKRILELHYEIENLNTLIEELIPNSEIAKRLLTIDGFGTICSGELAGEIGTIDRFKSEASLALYVGVGVLKKQSGIFDGSKCPRNVNPRAKAALMTAISRHVEINPESKKYYDKKRGEGKKHNQAIRSTGRHLIRVIWSMLKHKRNYIFKEEEHRKLRKINSTS